MFVHVNSRAVYRAVAHLVLTVIECRLCVGQSFTRKYFVLPHQSPLLTTPKASSMSLQPAEAELRLHLCPGIHIEVKC